MSQDELDKSEPTRLADALAIDPAAEVVLSPEELAAILQHQLDTALAVDLGEAADEATFGELLGAPRPSLELLQRVKCFAKFCKSTPDGPLPVPIATVLYFASIAKAVIAHDQRISALNDVELADGFRWSLQQPWVPQGLRELLVAGLVNLAR